MEKLGKILNSNDVAKKFQKGKCDVYILHMKNLFPFPLRMEAKIFEIIHFGV